MPLNRGSRERSSREAVRRIAIVQIEPRPFFRDHFIDKRGRTHGQMIQAARSGKPNIVEGSMASATSK